MRVLKKRNPWTSKGPNYTRRCKRCDKMFLTKAKRGKVCGTCHTGRNSVSSDGQDW